MKVIRVFVLALLVSLISFSEDLYAQKSKAKEIMYVGTYSTRDSKGIYVFEFDRAAGMLKALQTVTEGKSPNFLALHPNGKLLYAIYSEGTLSDNPAGGSVMSFRIDPETGFLTKLNEQSSEGRGPAHLSVDPKGKFAFVSNYGGGNLAIYPIQKDGSLGKASDFVQHEGGSTHPTRQKAPHVHSATPSLNGKFVYVSDLGTDKIMIYEVTKDGKLKSAGFASSTPSSGPRHFAIHPNGKFGFSAEELSSTIASYAMNTSTGAMTPLERVNMLPPNFNETNSAADIHVSPDGNYLYATNRGHESVVIFAIDKKSGKLTFIGHESTKGKHPRNFYVDSKGVFVFVANMNTDNVVVYKRDAVSGKMTATGEELSIPAPVSIELLKLK
jgi:6-phosphogluconolactonase